jgi:hypothetical protein
MLRLAADYEHMARHDVFKRWRWLAAAAVSPKSDQMF